MDVAGDLPALTAHKLFELRQLLHLAAGDPLIWIGRSVARQLAFQARDAFYGADIWQIERADAGNSEQLPLETRTLHNALIRIVADYDAIGLLYDLTPAQLETMERLTVETSRRFQRAERATEADASDRAPPDLVASSGGALSPGVIVRVGELGPELVLPSNDDEG